MFGLNNNQKEAMILTDGGISSQIIFHALGLYFEELGYNVKYDLKWFRENGKDLNGEFNRSFVMDKAFPSFDIKIATPEEAEVFYKKYYQKKSNLEKPKNKLYIYGYQNRVESFIKYRDVFAKNFNPIDKESIKGLLNEIEKNNSCAVHVRRGDLANSGTIYGKPTSVEYFINAIKIIRGLTGDDAVFYFFSEELDWVEKNILTRLDKDIKCVCVNQNDSDKGYLDLYLISRAKSVIASHGSFGLFGRLLSFNADKGYLIMAKNHENQVSTLYNSLINTLSNTILLSDNG